jgi:hypothetical protein
LWDLFEDRYEDSEGWNAFEDRYEDGFEEQGFFVFGDDFEDEGFFFDKDDFEGEDFVAGISQSLNQEAESGDVSQSFNASNTVDNSNQCAGIQGVANTGNTQYQIGVLQYGSEADDFSFEDSDSTITVIPNSATRCDQAVNQATTAYGL